MTQLLTFLVEKLPPFDGHKNPTVAAVLGFLFGGVGLGIYLRSFVDCLVPVLIMLFLANTVPDLGVLGGSIVASLWGYFRVVYSNAQLAK